MCVMKFCERVVDVLCVQVLCRGGPCGYVVKCRLSVVNFVDCLVWWLMWVVFVVHVGSVVL